jgi:hypothetical protein
MSEQLTPTVTEGESAPRPASKRKGGRKRTTAAPKKEETSRQRFSRLGPQRVQRALHAIRLIGNCGGANYESTDAERAKIRAALHEAVDEALRRLEPKEKKPSFQF